MEIFVQLLVLLIATRALGEVSARFGQPVLVGELIAGVLIALILTQLPADVPYLARLADSPVVELVAQLGVFFLILYAGVEMRPSEIAMHSRDSLLVALGGAVLPLAAGLGFGWLVLPEGEARFAQALLIGVTLSITAVPVTVRIFMELGLLHHHVGRTVVAAAIFDDVIALVMLAVLTAVIQEGSFPGVGTLFWLVARVVIFLAIASVIARFAFPLVRHGLTKARITAGAFSALVALGFGLAILAEALGMHFILGAFVAGLYFERQSIGHAAYDRVHQTLRLLTEGLLAPVFFVSIGLRLDLGALGAVPGLLGLLIAVAFMGKLVGAGLPALLTGMKPREAAAVGVGMSGRGVVSVVVAGIAFESGVFAQASNGDAVVANLFSALVITIVVTTIAVPLLLRPLAKGLKRNHHRRKARDRGPE